MEMPEVSIGNVGGDYIVDTLPTFPEGLKGNSAEGFEIEQGMEGYGKYAAFGRPGHANKTDAPGAFIQGNNPANFDPAGKPMSGNKEFELGETED